MTKKKAAEVTDHRLMTTEERPVELPMAQACEES